MQEDLETLKRALIVADRDLALAAVQRLVDTGTEATVILESGMAVAMFDLGEMWKRGEVFLPEVVASAETFCTVPRRSGIPGMGRSQAAINWGAESLAEDSVHCTRLGSCKVEAACGCAVPVSAGSWRIT